MEVTQPDKFSELAREIERDILDTLKASLPYFESDDRDDFIYLARIQDVKNAAGKIAALLRNRLGEERPVAYMCPVGCGCIWRDNHDDTMSLFGANSKSCSVCEFLPLSKLVPLNRVTATTEQPEVADWKPDSTQANAATFLGNCETPHFLGKPTSDRKALTQIPHYELPQGLCKSWRPLPAPPAEGESEGK